MGRLIYNDINILSIYLSNTRNNHLRQYLSPYHFRTKTNTPRLSGQPERALPPLITIPKTRYAIIFHLKLHTHITLRRFTTTETLLRTKQADSNRSLICVLSPASLNPTQISSQTSVAFLAQASGLPEATVGHCRLALTGGGYKGWELSASRLCSLCSRI